MKKAVIFALALMLAAGSFGVLPAGSSSLITVSAEGQADAAIPAEDVPVDLAADIVFKDGTVAYTDSQFEKIKKDDGRILYIATLKNYELDALLEKAGKTKDDILTVQYRMATEYTEEDEFDGDWIYECSMDTVLSNARNENESGTKGAVINKLVGRTYTRTELPESSSMLKMDLTNFYFEVIIKEPKVYKIPKEHADALQLDYFCGIELRLKDGTKFSTDMTFSKYELSAEEIEMTRYVTIEELEDILKAKGKKLEDFDKFVISYHTDYPKSTGMTFEDIVSGVTFTGNCYPVVSPDVECNNATDHLTAVTIEDLSIDGGGIWTALHPVSYYTKTVDDKEVKLDINDIKAFDLEILIGRENASVKRHEQPKDDPAPPDDDTTPPDDDITPPDDDTPTSDEDKLLKGDVNNDGKRDVTDLSKLAAHIKGVKELDAKVKPAGDINEDGKLDVTDLSKLAAHIKGIKGID